MFPSDTVENMLLCAVLEKKKKQVCVESGCSLDSRTIKLIKQASDHRGDGGEETKQKTQDTKIRKVCQAENKSWI